MSDICHLKKFQFLIEELNNNLCAAANRLKNLDTCRLDKVSASLEYARKNLGKLLKPYTIPDYTGDPVQRFVYDDEAGGIMYTADGAWYDYDSAGRIAHRFCRKYRLPQVRDAAALHRCYPDIRTMWGVDSRNKRGILEISDGGEAKLVDPAPYKDAPLIMIRKR